MKVESIAALKRLPVGTKIVMAYGPEKLVGQERYIVGSNSVDIMFAHSKDAPKAQWSRLSIPTAKEFRPEENGFSILDFAPLSHFQNTAMSDLRPAFTAEMLSAPEDKQAVTVTFSEDDVLYITRKTFDDVMSFAHDRWKSAIADGERVVILTYNVI